MLSQGQLLLALHHLNGGKYQDFRPKRVWEGEIKLGDLIEITHKTTRGGTERTDKRVGIVIELIQIATGWGIVLKAVSKEGKIVDGIRYGAIKSPIYSKTDIGRKEYDYDYDESFKICRISFPSEKRIERLYREFVEERHRAKAKAAEEARLEAERKAKEEEELRQRAIKAQKEEEERRSQTMTITVGMWEDLMRRVQDLEYSVDND